MSCILRAHGTEFDVAGFVEASAIRPDTVYEKGDPIAPGHSDGATRSSSGFSLTVSTHEDLEQEIRDAIAFLDEYEDDLRNLGSFEGVDGISLDFNIRWRDVAAQTDVFPSDLLWRVGALDIWLAVTHFPAIE